MTLARSVIGASRACAMVTMVLAAACGDDGGTGGSGAGTTSSTSSGPTGTATATSNASGSTTQTTSTQSSGSSSTGGTGFTSIGTSDYETQAALAADANGNVVAVWVAVNADGSSAIGYGVSHDGGATWTAPAYVAAPDGRLSSSPSIAVDGAGVFTLAWLGFTLDFDEPNEHVYVSRLAGGDVFGAPVVASDAGTSTTLDFDRPSVTTDADDDVLLVFSDFSLTAQGGPASTVFARSADGATFERTVVADDATFGNLAHLCLDRSFGADAPLYLVHLGAGNTVTLRRSTDRGDTWELGGEVGATDVLFQQPTCVALGDTVVEVAWASGDDPFSPGDDTPADRVDVSASTDGGTSFTHPSTVTDGTAQYLYPRIARGNGKRVVTYYAGTVGGLATLTESASADGTAWTRAPIADVGTFTVDLALASWLGGQTGVAIPGASVLAAFAENGQNVTHIAFAEAAVP